MSNISNYEIVDGTLKKYIGNDSEVIIPEGVSLIDVGAFRENKTLKKLVLNKDLEVINPLAFRECTNLKEVLFNDGLKSIGSGAFSYCDALESVTLPESLKILGPAAFACCGSLKKVLLPSMVEMSSSGGKLVPADGAFNRCSKLLSAGPKGSGKDIEFSWKTEIPAMALYGSSLKEIVVPDTITYISYHALKQKNDLETFSFNGSGFVKNNESGLKVTLPFACNVEDDSFDKDVFLVFSTPISSKDKMGAGLDNYANTNTINNLSDEELAWILLYQSKKWRASIIKNTSAERKESIITCIYSVLEKTKKISKTQGNTIVDLLESTQGSQSYAKNAVDMKTFLTIRNCESASRL